MSIYPRTRSARLSSASAALPGRRCWAARTHRRRAVSRSDDKAVRQPRPPRVPRGLPLRAVAPNAVTALALCSGLTGIRFAIASQWELAAAMVLIAGVLDGLDGRIARMLHG